jgi:hypothetical protein
VGPAEGKLTDTDRRFPDPDRRQHQRLGGKIATSPRDLTTWEHCLPWARYTIPSAVRRVKDSCVAAGVRLAAAAACSRAANAGSRPRGPSLGTVPPTARRLPVSGDAGRPPSVTAPATTASSADATRVNAIANDSVRHKPSHRSPRPRASAQTPRRKKFPAARATDPAATNSSSCRGALSSSVSVRLGAVRLYDASASVRRVLGSVAGKGFAPDEGNPVRRLTAIFDVVEYVFSRRLTLAFPGPQEQREERVKTGSPTPRFLSL